MKWKKSIPKRMIASLFVVSSLSLSSGFAHAQPETESFGIVWSKALGANDRTKGNALSQTADEGFIIAGGAGPTAATPYLLKVDKLGTKQWEQRYSSIAGSELTTVLPLQAGGYFLSGLQRISDKKANLVFIKVDAAGKLLWTKTAPAKSSELSPTATFQTHDHGFLIAGPSFVMKTDQNGTLLWNLDDDAIQGIRTASESENGVITLQGAGVLMSVDGHGKNKQVKISPYASSFQSAALLSDGGLVYVNKFSDKIIKIDKSGTTVWEKELDLDLRPVTQMDGTADGGFAIISLIGSTNMVHKFDAAGNRMGNARFGTAEANGIQAFDFVTETKDGSYVLIGNRVNEAPKNGEIVLYKTELFEPSKIKSLRLINGSDTLTVGGANRVKLLATLLDGSVKDVTAEARWVSEDEELFTVEKGKITAIKAGTAKVVALYEQTGITLDLSIFPAKK